MLKIDSNIEEAIARVVKLQRAIPVAIVRVVNDEAHWRSRGRTIASDTLLRLAGDKAEMVPAYVDRVVASHGAGDAPELTLSISQPDAMGSDQSLHGGDYLTIPLILVEVWRDAFFNADRSLVKQVILDWVTSHSKDLDERDMEGGAGGVFNYDKIANRIYNIIFRTNNTTLLETEAESGPHGGGGARLLDFFAEHPLTAGLVPEALEQMANEWLSIVLAAWHAAIPEEVVVRLQEEIAKI